jgi:hypothetical protein
VIGLPLGEGRAGRASTGHAGCQSDHSAAFNTVLPPARADRNGQDDDAGAPDVGKNHDLADSSVPVTTTNHLTQQPHVKNQPAESLTLQGLIGIGGSLAAPPLPHHRAYGSVHGGSRSGANTLGAGMGDRAI